MQRKSWIALTAAVLTLGFIVGWFSAGRMAAHDSERYTLDALSNARYVQAKERASLVHLLENKEVRKAEDLLYIVLNGNFKDYAQSGDTAEQKKACELVKLLGSGFASTPGQPTSRQALVESIQLTKAKCGGN